MKLDPEQEPLPLINQKAHQLKPGQQDYIINPATIYIGFSALDSCRDKARCAGKGRSLAQRRNTVPARIQSAQALDNKEVWAATSAFTARRTGAAAVILRPVCSTQSVEALVAAEPDINCCQVNTISNPRKVLSTQFTKGRNE